MRAIIFTLLLWLTNNMLFSQNNLLFPTSSDNPVWGQINHNLFSGDKFIIYGLNGDTTINSIKYSKLYIQADTIPSSKDTYYGALRDNSEKQVYIVAKGEPTEKLLFDFSKNITDTIRLMNSYIIQNIDTYIDYVVIQNIDTLMINDNLHKVFTVIDNNNHGFGKWIEGIGNDGEIFVPITIAIDNGSSSFLSCFKKNNHIYYPNAESDCFKQNMTSIIEKKSDNQSILVYPNPSETELTILDKNSNCENVAIFNINGLEVAHYGFKNTDKVIINTTDFYSGLYLIKCKMKNGSYYSIKQLIK